MPDSYLAQPVSTFLEALAAGRPAPGGGSAAALVVAQSAALCAMAARLSGRQLTTERAQLLTSDGDKIWRAAASLITLDAQAYLRVIEATRAAKATTPGTPGTAEAVAAALSHATEVPMRLVELAVESAKLARELAANGDRVLRGEAITAGLLAEAGAAAAAALVRINLESMPADKRLARLDELLTEIAELGSRSPSSCSTGSAAEPEIGGADRMN
jgi:formiminotetrahydrofolate cyclodeaminase